MGWDHSFDLVVVGTGAAGLSAAIRAHDLGRRVVLLEATAEQYPDTLESRHLLHVGATRAAHQLWVVCSGTPSHLLPAELTHRDA